MSPLEVKVSVYKVNPYSLVWEGKKPFTKKGQEETFVRFTMDKDGSVKPPFRFLKRRMVSPLMTSGSVDPPYLTHLNHIVMLSIMQWWYSIRFTEFTTRCKRR